MVYCISDIHGELMRWQSMLNQIQFSHCDTLYVLGDVIDRKPHGIEILQDIMSRQNIKFILGNHDQMMLDALEDNDNCPARYLWTQNGGRSTYV